MLVPGKKCSANVSRIVPIPSSSSVPFSRNRLTTSIIRRRSPSSWSSQPNVDAVKAIRSSASNPWAVGDSPCLIRVWSHSIATHRGPVSGTSTAIASASAFEAPERAVLARCLDSNVPDPPPVSLMRKQAQDADQAVAALPFPAAAGGPPSGPGACCGRSPPTGSPRSDSVRPSVRSCDVKEQWG